jgi:ribosomal protein S27AE
MEKERLKKISEELIEEMDVWTIANSEATFLEREVKARELASLLEASLIEESAKEKEELERPTCPHCQGELQWRGKRVRRLQASMGREIELKRKYATCPKCGTGFFPP